MDPNANLKEQIDFAQAIVAAWDKCIPTRCDPDQEAMTVMAYQAEEFARLFLALNEWITNGGVLPAAWNRETK